MKIQNTTNIDSPNPGAKNKIKAACLKDGFFVGVTNGILESKTYTVNFPNARLQKMLESQEFIMTFW